MLSRAEASRLAALRRRRGRLESGLFLAEGVRVVEDLLASGVVPHTALVTPSLEDTARGAELAAKLRAAVRTLDVSGHELARIAGTDSPQGVVVAAEIPRRSLADVRLRARDLVVVLDAVQDPGNFGSIVRSADAFGAGLVCTLPGTVDPWNPKAVRAAAGSSLRIPIVDGAAGEVLGFLRDAGFHVLGAASDGSPVHTVPGAARHAVVLGNEGAGLGDSVRPLLDGLVAVPIRGPTDSLNVGVAAGILLYMLSREL
jgi:RNA methyltransferase, TrmH family